MCSVRLGMRLASTLTAVLAMASLGSAEDWLQFKFDERHSGNVPGRSVRTPLGLVGAVPLSDAILTSPVIADGQIYVVDAAGCAYAIDAQTLEVRWRFESAGGAANCNNISSPAIVGEYLHFGTMAGPSIDSRECVGSSVSNGRIFYTSQASGLQTSQVAGEEAATTAPPWER
jgi:outer membrane protein assembly factor BamB